MNQNDYISNKIDSHEWVLKSRHQFHFDHPIEEEISTFLLNSTLRNSTTENDNGIVNGKTGERCRYTEFDKLSRNVASSLHKRGHRNGDTVVFLSLDHPNTLPFLIGVWRANGIPVVATNSNELLKIVVESQALWVVCDGTNSASCIKMLKTCPWHPEVVAFGINLTGDGIPAEEFFLDNGDSCPDDQSRHRTDICLIVSRDKILGDCNQKILIYYTFERLYQHFNLTTNEKFPQYPKAPIVFYRKSTFADFVRILAFVVAGREQILANSATPEQIVKIISKHKPGTIFISPANFMNVMTYSSNIDLSSVEFVSIDGPGLHIIPPTSLLQLKNFNTTYALTECGILTTTCVSGGTPSVDASPLSVGTLLAGTLLVVKSATGKILPPDQCGHLYFKTPRISNGYFRVGSDEIFSNGWVRSGNIGFYDENGFVYVDNSEMEQFRLYKNQIAIKAEKLNEKVIQDLQKANLASIKSEKKLEPEPTAKLFDFSYPCHIKNQSNRKTNLQLK